MNYFVRQKYLNYVQELPEGIVNSFKHKNEYIWPLFITFSFNELVIKTPQINVEKSVSKRFMNFLKFLKIIKFIIKRGPKVFFFGAPVYRARVDDLKRNKYFDMFMDSLNETEFTPILFDYKINSDLEGIYKYDRVIELEGSRFLVKLISRISRDEDKVLIENEAELLKIIIHLNTEFNSNITLENFKMYLLVINKWSYFFKILLRIIRPNSVFILCYYSRYMSALCKACRELKIPTYDIQHGSQGNMHINYAPFNQIPMDGYSYLPNFFWVWDISTSLIIESWANKQNYHKVILGGNPWRQFVYLNNIITGSKSAVEKPFIVLTLQTKDPIIEDYLLDLIFSTHGKFQWWIRIHPRTLPDQINLVTYKLKPLIDSNLIRLEYGDYVHLVHLFSYASIHLSKYSGSILEAYEEGVFSIILDKTGEEIYANIIYAGGALACTDQSSATLKTIIEEALSKKISAKNLIDSKAMFINELKVKS